MSLSDKVLAKIKTVDLSTIAEGAMEQYKEVMQEKVPQGLSPVKNGEWVASLNEGYEGVKYRDGYEGYADLDYGKKRYLTAFNKVAKGADSITFDFNSDYKPIAEKHQSGRYDYGNVKPRELVPQNKAGLPDQVISAVRELFKKGLENAFK